MSTANDLITRALKSFNAIAPGENPTGAEAADALDTLNSMLGQWNIESLNIYAEVINAYNLAAGTQTYTIGTGGVFNSARPLKITSANIITTTLTPVTRTPIEIINADQWSEISVQSQPALTYPTRLYYDKAFPLATIYLWGTPSSGLQLELFTWSPISTFAAITTSFSMPAEYEEALIYNLAVRLMPAYGTFNEVILGLAQRAIKNLQDYNAVTPVMGSDLAASSVTTGTFNIYSGQ